MSDIEQKPPAAEETGPTEGEQPAAEEWVPPGTPPKPEAPLSEAEKYFQKIIGK